MAPTAAEVLGRIKERNLGRRAGWPADLGGFKGVVRLPGVVWGPVFAALGMTSADCQVFRSCWDLPLLRMVTNWALCNVKTPPGNPPVLRAANVELNPSLFGTQELRSRPRVALSAQVRGSRSVIAVAASSDHYMLWFGSVGTLHLVP